MCECSNFHFYSSRRRCLGELRMFLRLETLSDVCLLMCVYMVIHVDMSVYLLCVYIVCTCVCQSVSSSIVLIIPHLLF